MLNVVLVGGAKVQELIDNKYIDTDKYNIVKTHKFVECAFDDILNNYAEYLDVNVIVVLQYGIKDNGEQEVQIRDLQEVISVSTIKSKLYFVLNDLSLYTKLEEQEEPVVYKRGRILHLPNMYNKSIMDIIEGKMDDEGISMEYIDKEEEYYEDDLDDLEVDPDEKKFVYEPEPMNEETHGDKDNITLKDIRKKKSFFGGIKKEMQDDLGDPGNIGEPIKSTPFKSSGGSYSKGSFSGVIGVTGDRNSGVSTTAANLAEIYAQMGKTVLVIDLDLFRRFMYIIYPEIADHAISNPRTQLGVYYSLNNTSLVEEVSVIVKDNLALLGNSRSPEYYTSPFVDRKFEDIAIPAKVSTLIGVAKGIYDIVIVDFPLDQIRKLMESTIIIDKFIICVENDINSMDTLFNIVLADMMIDHEMYVESMLAKSSIVLTKYTSSSKYGRKELTEEVAEEIVRGSVYSKMRVAGKISYSNVFSNVGASSRSLVELHDVTRNEFIKIAENMGV